MIIEAPTVAMSEALSQPDLPRIGLSSKTWIKNPTRAAPITPRKKAGKSGKDTWLRAVQATYPPTKYSDPCAKLSIRSEPQIKVKPRAIKPYTEPLSKPP